MKRIVAVGLVAAMYCGAASLAVAETGDQTAKEQKVTQKVTQKVKARGGKEKMMPPPQVQLKRLTKGLQLTAQQQKQIKPMLDEEYASLKKIRTDENLSPKQIQVQVEALRTDTIGKIQTVLTSEQKEKHALVSEEIKANKQKRMQENRKARLGTQSDPPKAAAQ